MQTTLIPTQTPHMPAWAGGAWLHWPWRRLADAVARVQRDLHQRREFERLDASALRDLGLHRSELASYLAECTGSAEPTRRRIAASN